MATKKEKEAPSIEELLDSGLVMKGSDPRLIIRKLPTTIPGLDDLLGGGWPAGRYTQIYGPESTGKTVLMQYATASQQKDPNRPLCLILDFERGYDPAWWQESGVNTEDLLVAQPMTGEEGIDVILAVIKASDYSDENKLGLVGVDSIAMMMPKAMADPEKGAEQKFMGAHSALVAKFFAMITPQMDDIVFILNNQMRSNIGGYEELTTGGWAMRHNNHVTLRTRREGWLTEGNERIGFVMEVINKKNKVGGVQNDSLEIPFKFKGQIDMIQSYIDEAMEKKIIKTKGPYYYWGDEKTLGKGALRKMFMESPEAFEKLKEQLSGDTE